MNPRKHFNPIASAFTFVPRGAGIAFFAGYALVFGVWAIAEVTR